MTGSNTADIHAWRILDLGEYMMLVGQIYNDSAGRFDNGQTVRTSFILELNKAEGWARTKNTTYRLK